MKPSNTFWIAVAVTAVAHNVWAALTGHEQLSEAVDRYRVAAPLATDVVIAVTAAHLMRQLPSWVDPLTWLSLLVVRFAHPCAHTRTVVNVS